MWKTSRIKAPDNLFLWAGLALIFAGIIGNEWILTKFISPDGSLSTYSRFVVWTADLTMIFAGLVLTTQKGWSFLRWTGVGMLAMIVISLLVGYAFRMAYLFQIDYNEGWNVYHVVDAVSNRLLYADRLTLAPVNYPPISFYLVGSVGKLLHNPLLAGRIISLISLVLASAISGLVVRQLGGSNLSAIFSSLFCMGIFVTYGRGYVAMNDPHMLGQFIMLIGLIVYLNNESKWLPVALLCCLGIFVKHTLISIPLAISMNILIRSRKVFFRWVLTCLTISGILLAVTMSLGSEFIYQITAPRGYDPERIFFWLSRLGPAILITLFLAIPWLVDAAKNHLGRTISLYLVISIVFGLYACGGSGTDINMFFDFFIGLSIAVSMSFDYLCKKLEALNKWPSLASVLLPIMLSFGILIQFPQQFPRRATFDRYNQQEEVFLEDTDYLASKPEPVICSNILLCYVAGHDFTFDPFLVTEGSLSGRCQEKEIVAQLEAGHYQVIQLNYPLEEYYYTGLPYTSIQRSNTDFTENFLRALGNHYVLTRETSTGAFYEPIK